MIQHATHYASTRAPVHRSGHAPLVRAALTALTLATAGCQALMRGETLPPHPRPAQRVFVPPSSYENYIRGEVLLEQGRYDEAVRAFQLAATAPDEDPYLLSRLALAQALGGHPEQAELSLQAAESVDACSEAAARVRGELRARAGRGPEAIDAYARAVACAPGSEAALMALARELGRQGRVEHAKEVLRTAHKPRAARLLLELALLDEDPVQIASALETLSTEQAPLTPSLVRAIEQALLKGRPLLALRFVNAAPAALPKVLVAKTLLAAGRQEEARALLERAREDELGSSVEAGQLLLAAGLFERAELTAALPASDATEQLERILIRARALAALGRTDEAARLLAQAPGEPRAKAVLLEMAERAAVPRGLLPLSAENAN